MTPLGGSTQISEVPTTKQNGTTSVYSKKLKLEGKVYKLVIQVDKIRAKPGPKCMKPALLAATRREKISTIREILDEHRGDGTQNNVDIKHDVVVQVKPDDKDVNIKSNGNDVEIKLDVGNVKIKVDGKDVRMKSDVEIQSELSGRQSNIRNHSNQCPVCQVQLESLLALFSHHEMKHFVCQLCDAPFASQVACDKHETQHQGNDGLLVYKCHLCEKSYDCTKNLKVHLKGSHWEVLDIGWKVGSEEVKGFVDRLDYECGICRVSLKNEEVYRNHMVLHQMNANNSILKAPEKISDMHLSDQQNLKLTCTICTQTFTTPSAAEAHICSLRKPEVYSKVCSICKRKFDNMDSLNQHVAAHISRAHHCTVCRKLFVNRVTLAVHMKTHRNHN